MAELSREARALLETIAGPESAGNYDIIYGGGRFSDYADHPRQYVTITSGPNKGQKSSAAGKYQFLGSTWDDQAQKLGLNDFSPGSQDMAAWNLAQEEYRRDTGRDLAADLASGDLSRVAPSLRNQWTSMPGGIEQGITGDAFSRAYAEALASAEPQFRNVGIPQPRPNTVPRSIMSYAATEGGPRNSALGAIDNATGTGGGGFWSSPIASLMSMELPKFPQIQPQQKQSIMNMAMGSLPARTAFVKSLMNQNVGPAPSVSQGHSGPGTRALAVTGKGSAPVSLMGSLSGSGSSGDGSNPSGMNKDIYRANAAVLGPGNFNQKAIGEALSGGRTLYKLA